MPMRERETEAALPKEAGWLEAAVRPARERLLDRRRAEGAVEPAELELDAAGLIREDDLEEALRLVRG